MDAPVFAGRFNLNAFSGVEFKFRVPIFWESREQEDGIPVRLNQHGLDSLLGNAPVVMVGYPVAVYIKCWETVAVVQNVPSFCNPRYAANTLLLCQQL